MRSSGFRSLIPPIPLSDPHVARQGDAPARVPARRFRTLFLSDTHLGRKGCRADRLLDFLESHDAGLIYLVGDIFDNRRRVQSNIWSPTHDAVIQNLMGKVRNGTRIVYVPGNHDAIFRRHYGVYFDCIEVVESALHTAADGKRYLVIHGDCFDVVIKHALWLSSVGGRIEDVVRGLNGALNRLRRWRGLADWSLTETILARVNHLVTRGDLFQERLATLVLRSGAEGVICGHFHSAAIHQEFGVAYVNCGDWLENCTAVAEDSAGRLQIISWKHPRTAPQPHEFSPEAEAASTPAP